MVVVLAAQSLMYLFWVISSRSITDRIQADIPVVQFFVISLA